MNILLTTPTMIRPKKSLFPVTLPYQVFIPKNPYPSFSALTTPNQRKTYIKHTFLTQKIMQFFFILPSYLPFFFSDRYRKQTISFFRPNITAKKYILCIINGIKFGHSCRWICICNNVSFHFNHWINFLATKCSMQYV